MFQHVIDAFNAITAGDVNGLQEGLLNIIDAGAQSPHAEQHPSEAPASDSTQILDEVQLPNTSTNLIECAVRANFLAGVHVLLNETNPLTRPDPDSVRKALFIAKSNFQLSILRVFLEAALQSDNLELRRTVNISATDVLLDAIRLKELHDVALRAINTPELDVNLTLDVLDNRLLALVASKGNEVLVDAMLRHGAVVDAPAGDGSTALMHAALAASLPCCRVLLQHGADPNHRAPSHAFVSPLRAASVGCRRGGSVSSVFWEVLELFVSAGLNVSHERDWVMNLVQRIDKDINGNIAEVRRIGISDQGIDIAHGRHIIDANLETDVANARRIVNETSADDCERAALRQLKDRLLDLHSNPQSLLMACFALIRRRLSDVGRGTSIIGLIGRLPLPASAKRVLTLDYVQPV